MIAVAHRPDYWSIVSPSLFIDINRPTYPQEVFRLIRPFRRDTHRVIVQFRQDRFAAFVGGFCQRIDRREQLLQGASNKSGKLRAR